MGWKRRCERQLRGWKWRWEKEERCTHSRRSLLSPHRKLLDVGLDVRQIRSSVETHHVPIDVSALLDESERRGVRDVPLGLGELVKVVGKEISNPEKRTEEKVRKLRSADDGKTYSAKSFPNAPQYSSTISPVHASNLHDIRTIRQLRKVSALVISKAKPALRSTERAFSRTKLTRGRIRRGSVL